MWLTSETEDEFVVCGLPAILWAAGGALFFVGMYLLFSNLPSFLNWAKPVENPTATFFLAFGMLFIPLVSLSLFVIFPMIITRFNRRERQIYYSTFRLVLVHRRRISYDQLEGGVHISEEYDSENGGNTYEAYFELKNGERLKMCSEPGQFQGRNYDVGMRANEFLQRKHLAQSNEDVITLGLNR